MKLLAPLILSLALIGCSHSQPNKTITLLSEVKQNLTDAKVAIDQAAKHVDNGLIVVGETQESAKADSKEFTETKRELTKLKNNLWVRAALTIRTWFYVILISYIVIGLLSGFVVHRGIGPIRLATTIIENLPLSPIFKFGGKLIGRLFFKK